MTTITIDRALLEQALEVLELGYDTAKAEADRYHTAMAGFRPERHAQMDAEVQQIVAAITALRAALAQEPQTTHSDECWRWHHKCAVAKIERERLGRRDPRPRLE